VSEKIEIRRALQEKLDQLRAALPGLKTLDGLAVRAKINEVKAAIKFLDRREVVPATYLNDDYAKRARNRAQRWFRNNDLRYCSPPDHIVQKARET
jgi:hypothetical protein